VHAVHEARTWAGWIAQGKVTTLKELAERAGRSRRHTSRVLRLAALSPALSESIQRGEHAPELTLERLTQNLPLNWALQSLPS
jgi:ParB-like chromosome segregation protein Spo0J